MADQVDTGQLNTGQLETGQVGSGPVSGAGHGPAELGQDAPGTPGNYEPFHGRPISWVGVSIIVAGFLAGSLALVFGPTWWLFWAGAAVAVVGLLVMLTTDTFEDWY
jgi:hypothetical protein